MADTKKYDYVFKVLIIGEVASGKTALLDRYAENSFTNAYIPTIGVDFGVKSEKYNGKIIKAQVWDTAGQERFRAVTASYYRGCHGVIIVFDVTNRSTFERVENRITEFETYGPESVPKLLVGNKCDLANERCVTTEEAKSMAVIKNMSYIETSAKTNTNVEDAFETLYDNMLKNVCNQVAPPENISRPDEEGVPGEKEGMSSEKGGVAVEAESVASVNSENTPPWVNEILEGLNKFGTRLEVVDKLESTVATMSKRLDELEIKVQNMTKEK